MLPTARWKLRLEIRQGYESRIRTLEDSLKIQRAMAGELLDEGNLEAVASMHLTLIQDEEEVENVKAKLELLNDDACFEKVFDEQTQAGYDDDR